MLNLISFTAGVFGLCAPSAPHAKHYHMWVCDEERTVRIDDFQTFVDDREIVHISF